MAKAMPKRDARGRFIKAAQVPQLVPVTTLATVRGWTDAQLEHAVWVAVQTERDVWMARLWNTVSVAVAVLAIVGAWAVAS